MNFTKKNTLLLFQLIALLANAQFHPQVGIAGNNAIHKDSSIIKSWAASCKINRGYQDITNTSLGLTNTGDSSLVIGPADGSGVVSLGDGGEAILTFNSPIINGPGVDFCVFENAFLPGFLELATLSVSSDGINFFTFPPTSNTPTLTQVGPFDAVLDASKLNNLAGKYIANYGTPFDLQELAGNLQLNINAITHVKIKDVVGCLSCNNKTLDKNNQVINDPFTTPFASGGFDLDAVGVINQQAVTIKEIDEFKALIVVKTEANKICILNKSEFNFKMEILSIIGELFEKADLINHSIHTTADLPQGCYLVRFFDYQKSFTRKVIIR